VKRILLIEDNHSLREEIVNVLEMEGYTVAEAANGRLGVESLQTEQPDLVLCDLMMPEMDGYATLEAIRGNPATAHLPVILLTAREDDVCESRCRELGADDYVTKPFRIPDLMRAVDAVVKKYARKGGVA
jgi:CheY-like chemotaxis protein